MTTFNDIFFKPLASDELVPATSDPAPKSEQPRRSLVKYPDSVAELFETDAFPDVGDSDGTSPSAPSPGASDGGRPQGVYSLGERLWHEYYAKGQVPPIAVLLEYEQECGGFASKVAPPKKRQQRPEPRPYTAPTPPEPVNRGALLAKYGLTTFDC